MKFVRDKTADQAEQDHETIIRVRAMLQGYYAQAGHGAMVSVSHVLDLLDPRGLWSLDPVTRRNIEQQQETGQPQELPPGADPLTGCLPVTAPPPRPDPAEGP